MLVRRIFLFAALFLLFVQTEVWSQDKKDTIVISLKALTGLQYDQVRFSVRPSVTVKLTLINSDDMSHNLVFTLPGKRQDVVDAALKLGDKGTVLNYIPQLPSVLWSIPVISPGESMTITFTVPEKPGIYPFVCTYPGHGFVMYGAMYVTDGALPPLNEDLNIPPGRRSDGFKISSVDHSTHGMKSHPYETIPPYLYRTFVEDAGPAAIAVRLPQSLSYFWDAGQCRLRYATIGDFLDMKDLWAGHKQTVAKNQGAVFYKDKTDYPIRLASPGNIPEVQFKGYSYLDRYPEFHYLLNGIDVYELIKEIKDGTGLLRTFRIPNANQNIWFVFSPDDGVDYSFSGGKLADGSLQLSPVEAKHFTIKMTKKGGRL